MSTRLKGSRPPSKGAGFLEEFRKDEIKGKVDIIALMESFGIHVEKKGASWMGLCPFHDDKNPSLSVDRSKGLYHCFGCGEGGDVFDLVMKVQSSDFPGALEFLKTFSGKSLLRSESSAAIFSESSSDSLSLSDVIGSYRRDLEASRKAQGYLKDRSLFHPEILSRLEVGYSPGRLLERTGEKGRAALKETGLLSAQGRELFSGCLTVPLRNFDGIAVSLYGRRLTDSSPRHLYSSGSHRGLLNPLAYKVYPERMIWTESVLDAMSLMSLGFLNVDALYGTGGLSEDHIQALKEARTQEIVLALDNDEAGIQGAAKLSAKLSALRISIGTMFPPEPFKDWNDCLVGNPAGAREVVEGLLASVESAFLSSSTLKISKKKGCCTAVSSELTYRVIGIKEDFVSTHKVNIRATLGAQKESLAPDQHPDAPRRRFIDNVDLFSSRSRSMFALQLARSFSLESARIERDLLDILEYLEGQRENENAIEETPGLLTSQQKEKGMALLTDPELFERIEEDLEELGFVGESVNKRLMYLAASSRKMESPISLIVMSQSASGKSYLIDTVKKLMPPEDVVSLTSLSDQALNYMDDEALVGKLLTLGEAVHSEAVEYQLREMLSSGELSRLVTLKDEKSGRMVSKMVRKKVKVAMVMSSTSTRINEENASRCFLIGADESQAQTEAIHRRQREKYSLEAYRRKEEKIPPIIATHQAAGRLLAPRKIVNPFADMLTFPSSRMRTRRDHERFIDLIAAVCFLRQYQKQPSAARESEYILCDIADYRIAYDLMNAILPSTLSELPSSALRVYQALKGLIETRSTQFNIPAADMWVTQRELRERSGLSHDLVKKNLRRLVEWEYVKARGSRQGMSYRYALSEQIECPAGSLLPSPRSIEKRLSSGAGGANWGQQK